MLCSLFRPTGVAEVAVGHPDEEEVGFCEVDKETAHTGDGAGVRDP